MMWLEINDIENAIESVKDVDIFLYDFFIRLSKFGNKTKVINKFKRKYIKIVSDAIVDIKCSMKGNDLFMLRQYKELLSKYLDDSLPDFIRTIYNLDENSNKVYILMDILKERFMSDLDLEKIRNY